MAAGSTSAGGDRGSDGNRERRVPLMMRALRALFILPIRLYRLIVSPWLPPSCIYTPTCSHYAQDAIAWHGVFKGLLLALARVFRCSALFRGGEDPVPSRFSPAEIREGYRRFRRRQP